MLRTSSCSFRFNRRTKLYYCNIKDGFESVKFLSYFSSRILDLSAFSLLESGGRFLPLGAIVKSWKNNDDYQTDLSLNKTLKINGSCCNVKCCRDSGGLSQSFSSPPVLFGYNALDLWQTLSRLPTSTSNEHKKKLILLVDSQPERGGS